MKSNRVKKKSFTGFTLVEVITTLVILALIAAIAIPSLVGYIDSAREKAAVEECRIVVEAASDLATDYALETGVIAYDGADYNVNKEVTSEAIMELSEAGGEIKEYSFDPKKSNKYTEPTYLVNNDEVVVSGAKGIELAKDVSTLAVSVDDSDYETYAVKGVSLTYMEYTASNGVEVIYYNDGYDEVEELSDTTHIHEMQPVGIHQDLTCTDDEITLFKCTTCAYNYLSVTAEAPGHNVEAISKTEHNCTNELQRHTVENKKLVDGVKYTCDDYTCDNKDCTTEGAHNHDFSSGSTLVSQQAHTYEMLTAEDYTGKAIINGVFCEKSNFDGTVKYTNIQYCTVCGILQCDKYEESKDDTNSGSGKLIRMVDQSNQEITAGGKYYLVSAGGAKVGPLTIDGGYLKGENDEFIKVAYDASGNGVTNSNKVYASSTGTTYTLVEETAVEGYQAIASGTKITIKVKNINGGMLEDISATGSNSEIIDKESMEVVVKLNPLLYFTVKLQGNNGTNITSLKNGVYDLTDSSGNTTVATITVNENSRYTVAGTDVNGGSVTEEFSFAEGVRFYINAKNSTKSTSDGVSTKKLCLSVGEYHLYERNCPDGWQTIGDDKYILIDLSSFSFKATLTSQLKNVSLTVAQAGFLNYNSATEYDTENGQHLTKKDAVYDENGEYSDPTLQIEYKKTKEEDTDSDVEPGNWVITPNEGYSDTDIKNDLKSTVTGNANGWGNAGQWVATDDKGNGKSESLPYGALVSVTNDSSKYIKSFSVTFTCTYSGIYSNGTIDETTAASVKSVTNDHRDTYDYEVTYGESNGQKTISVTIKSTEAYAELALNYNQKNQTITPNGGSYNFYIEYNQSLWKDATYEITVNDVEYIDTYEVPIEVNYYGSEKIGKLEINNSNPVTSGAATSWLGSELNGTNPVCKLTVYETNSSDPVKINVYGEARNQYESYNWSQVLYTVEIPQSEIRASLGKTLVVNIGEPTEPDMLNESGADKFIVTYNGDDYADVTTLRITVNGVEYETKVESTEAPEDCKNSSKKENRGRHFIVFKDDDDKEGYSFAVLKSTANEKDVEIELLDDGVVVATGRVKNNDIKDGGKSSHKNCSAVSVKFNVDVPDTVESNKNDYKVYIDGTPYSVDEALNGVRISDCSGKTITASVQSTDGTTVCKEQSYEVQSKDLGTTYTFEFKDESVVVKVNLTDSGDVTYDTEHMTVEIDGEIYKMTDALSGIRLYSPKKATIKIIGVDDSELSSKNNVDLSECYGETYTYDYSSKNNTITIKLDSTKYSDLYEYINSVYVKREAGALSSRTAMEITVNKTFDEAPSNSVIVEIGGFASSNSNGTTVQVKDKDGNVIAQAEPNTGIDKFTGVFGGDITVTPTCYLFNVSTAFSDEDLTKLGSLTSATLTVENISNTLSDKTVALNGTATEILVIPADDATKLKFTLTDSSGQPISTKKVTLDTNYLGKVQNVTFDAVEEDYTAPIVTASDKISLKITFDCDLASEVTQVEVDGTNYPVTDTQNIVVQNFKPSNASQYYCAPITIKLKNTDDTVLGEATLSDYWNEMSTTVNVDITPTAIKIYAELPEGMEETGLQFRLNNGSYTSLSKMKNGLTYAPSGDLRVDLYRNDTWITYVTVPQTTLKSYLGSSYTVNFEYNFLNLKFTVPSVYEESTLSIQVGNDTKSYSNVSGGWLYAPGSGTTSFNVYLKQNDTTIATATVANFTSSMGRDYTVDFTKKFVTLKFDEKYANWYILIDGDDNSWWQAKQLSAKGECTFAPTSNTISIKLRQWQYYGDYQTISVDVSNAYGTTLEVTFD